MPIVDLKKKKEKKKMVPPLSESLTRFTIKLYNGKSIFKPKIQYAATVTCMLYMQQIKFI